MNEINLSKNYILQGIYIELTSECNLRCLHCYNESGNKSSLISTDEFKKTIECLVEGRETSVTLSGGEPLLHPNIWEYLDILDTKKYGKKLMITNATLITPQIAKKLAKHDINIQVSLNGSTSDTHDKLCGKGNFEKTMKGLDNLLAAGMKERILVRSMVSLFNCDDIINMIKVLKEKEIMQIDMASLTLLGRGKVNANKMYMQPEKKADFLREISSNEEIKKLKSEGMKIMFPDEFTGICPLIMDNIDGKQIPITPRIDSEGYVYMCQLFSGKNYAIGNIADNSLATILQDEPLSHMVWFLRYGMKYMHECEECIWNSSCGKGCLALALSNGSIQETDGECSLRKKQLLKDYMSMK